MTRGRWLVDAGVSGGIVAWQGWTLATADLAPFGVAFAACSMLAAGAVLIVLLRAG